MAKHGNRAASSEVRAADCLRALGVNDQAESGSLRKIIKKKWECASFLLKKYHTSMKYVGRSEKGTSDLNRI